MNPFQHNARNRRTPQQRAAIFLARGARCYKCTRKLGPGDDWDLDHVLALENGGSDDDSNLAPICDWCHTAKTADDHETAGHGRRMATKHCVPSRFRKSRSWR